MAINELIVQLSKDPFNPTLNFEVAKEYEKLEQTASAVSFYLRAAEYGYDSHPSIVYASLLRMSLCFNDQNDRQHTVTNCILQAIAYLPYRPEAYFLLSRFYERLSNWQECYTFAEVGLNLTCRLEPLPTNVEYPGRYALTFEKAVAAWWIGRKDESIKLFKELLAQNITPEYRNSVTHNLTKIAPNVAL